MSGDGIVDTGIMRNMHLLGFAAERGDLVIFGRPTKAAVAMALGFSQGEWETDMSWPVLLTDEEWQVALSTPGTV